MTSTTVPTPETTGESSEPGPYAETAAELRRMADDLAGLTGMPKPKYVMFHIQPALGADDERMAAVDAVASALLGMPGKTEHVSGGSYHHRAQGYCGPIGISIYQSVSNPEKRELEAELEKLRREASLLRGALAAGVDPAHVGLDFTEPDRLAEPTAAPVPAGVDGRQVGSRASSKACRP